MWVTDNEFYVLFVCKDEFIYVISLMQCVGGWVLKKILKGENFRIKCD